MNIIVINGSGGVGKDTFVEMCKKSEFVINVSSVDRVKEAAKLLGWDGVKDEKGRQFLSDLKDMSTSCYNGPMQYMKERIHQATINGLNPSFIFLHIREPAEIEKFVQEVPTAKTLLITRDNSESFSNHADANVRFYPYDHIVRNNGSLVDLRKTAINFMEEVKKHAAA